MKYRNRADYRNCKILLDKFPWNSHEANVFSLSGSIKDVWMTAQNTLLGSVSRENSKNGMWEPRKPIQAIQIEVNCLLFVQYISETKKSQSPETHTHNRNNSITS